MELLSCQGPAKSIDEAAKHKYQFWDTQPVPKLSKWLLITMNWYLSASIVIFMGTDTVVMAIIVAMFV